MFSIPLILTPSDMCISSDHIIERMFSTNYTYSHGHE